MNASAWRGEMIQATDHIDCILQTVMEALVRSPDYAFVVNAVTVRKSLANFRKDVVDLFDDIEG